MIQTIPVVTRLQDNGDGGYSLYAYNSEQELLADHPLARDGKMTEEVAKSILDEDDTYENGYISSDSINVEIDANGQLKLAKPLHFHCGQ